jgi:hypothetical protein
MRYLDPPAALAAQFQGLIHEPPFVRLVPQAGEVESRVRSLARDLNAGLRDGLPLARGDQVKILLGRKSEGLLERKPRWLLGPYGRSTQCQNQN